MGYVLADWGVKEVQSSKVKRKSGGWYFGSVDFEGGDMEAWIWLSGQTGVKIEQDEKICIQRTKGVAKGA